MNMAMSIINCGELDVAIWLHTDEDPGREPWSEATNQVASLKQTRGGDVSGIRTLAITDGGAPNSLQRKQLHSDVLGGNAPSTVISNVLSNRFKRGIVTAISWLNPSFRGFQPEDYLKAFEHIELGSHIDTIFAEVGKLQQQLPPVETWKLLKKLRA